MQENDYTVEDVNKKLLQRNDARKNKDFQTADKGYLITGETKSFSALSIDAIIVKTDKNGRVAN